MIISCFKSSSMIPSILLYLEKTKLIAHTHMKNRTSLLTLLLALSLPLGAQDVYTDHPCVDLGLSVKWATYNVGAEAPEQRGDLFA